MTSGAGAMQRRWEGLRAWGVAAFPYGFAISGIGLGVGGVVTDRPLAGACGAIAGVTAGLLEGARARDAEQRTEGMRERLRRQRADADRLTADLRREVTGLRVEAWEWRMHALTAQAAADEARDARSIDAGPAPDITGSTPIEAVARAAMAVEDAAARISAEIEAAAEVLEAAGAAVADGSGLGPGLGPGPGGEPVTVGGGAGAAGTATATKAEVVQAVALPAPSAPAPVSAVLPVVGSGDGNDGSADVPPAGMAGVAPSPAKADWARDGGPITGAIWIAPGIRFAPDAD